MLHQIMAGMTVLDKIGMLGVILLVFLFFGIEITNVNKRSKNVYVWLASVVLLGSAFMLGLGIFLSRMRGLF